MLHWIKERCYLVQSFLMIFVFVLAWQNYSSMRRVENLTESMLQENRSLVNQIETTNFYVISMVRQHLIKKDTIIQIKEKTHK